MGLPLFQKLRGELGPDALARVQDNLAATIQPLLSIAMLNGVLLSSLALASGTNAVNHQLGRTPVGWLLTRVRANATVYEDTTKVSVTTLQLVASAAVTVDVWVW